MPKTTYSEGCKHLSLRAAVRLNQSKEELPKLNVAGSSPVTRFVGWPSD